MEEKEIVKIKLFFWQKNDDIIFIVASIDLQGTVVNQTRLSMNISQT